MSEEPSVDRRHVEPAVPSSKQSTRRRRPWCRATRFPLLKNAPDLVYLDSAASAQKPAVVIDRLTRFYSGEYANIHRGLYPLERRGERGL